MISCKTETALFPGTDVKMRVVTNWIIRTIGVSLPPENGLYCVIAKQDWDVAAAYRK